MREIVFALEFRGRAEPAPGPGAARQARTSAPSQAFRTLLATSGIEATLEEIVGQRAALESTVERFADGSFIESGTIAYGEAGRLSFSTVGRGTVGPSPRPGWQDGAVVWTVTGGEGSLRGVRGLITSNFTVSATGEVIDDHFARLYLPA
jgi:hypothetical protein